MRRSVRSRLSRRITSCISSSVCRLPSSTPGPCRPGPARRRPRRRHANVGVDDRDTHRLRPASPPRRGFCFGADQDGIDESRRGGLHYAPRTVLIARMGDGGRQRRHPAAGCSRWCTPHGGGGIPRASPCGPGALLDRCDDFRGAGDDLVAVLVGAHAVEHDALFVRVRLAHDDPGRQGIARLDDRWKCRSWAI